MGSKFIIADIGEQLAWLGAACRASPSEGYHKHSLPSIKYRASLKLFDIRYRLEDIPKEKLFQDGTCWHSLFRNPVIVRGFPILARGHDERGLEISLDMMASLAGAERATVFGDQLVIKGFSTMLVPTKCSDNSVVWHFLFNEDGSRLPYSAIKERCPMRVGIDRVDYSCLTSSRHFLGWASKVSLHTGEQFSFLPSFSLFAELP